MSKINGQSKRILKEKPPENKKNATAPKKKNVLRTVRSTRPEVF